MPTSSLIGLLFRARAEDLTTKELVVFLTPRIISGEEPVLRLASVDLGCAAVQIYTSLIYQGPGVVRRLHRALAERQA